MGELRNQSLSKLTPSPPKDCISLFEKKRDGSLLNCCGCLTWLCVELAAEKVQQKTFSQVDEEIEDMVRTARGEAINKSSQPIRKLHDNLYGN